MTVARHPAGSRGWRRSASAWPDRSAIKESGKAKLAPAVVGEVGGFDTLPKLDAGRCCKACSHASAALKVDGRHDIGHVGRKRWMKRVMHDDPAVDRAGAIGSYHAARARGTIGA